MKTNKELKAAYKLKKFTIAVFQVRNMVNGKIFIGSSVNVEAIFNRIRAELKLGGHRNKKLQREWQEFTDENFSFEVLSEIVQKDEDRVDYGKEVKKLEEMFMEDLQPFGEKGYH